MPQDKKRTFLDFERPIKELIDDIEGLKQKAEKSKIDLSEPIKKLEERVIETRKTITQSLTAWQKVQDEPASRQALYTEIPLKRCPLILWSFLETEMCEMIRP